MIEAVGNSPQQIRRLAVRFIKLYSKWLKNFREENGGCPTSGLTEPRFSKVGYTAKFDIKLIQKEASNRISSQEKPPDHPIAEHAYDIVGSFYN